MASWWSPTALSSRTARSHRQAFLDRDRNGPTIMTDNHFDFTKAAHLDNERRDKKRAAKKSRMTHHGKSISIIYKHGIEKRAEKL